MLSKSSWKTLIFGLTATSDSAINKHYYTCGLRKVGPEATRTRLQLGPVLSHPTCTMQTIAGKGKARYFYRYAPALYLRPGKLLSFVRITINWTEV
jgi:hypothetical protein